MPARYRWVALSNTSLAVFMSAVDGSIVIIALPAIFRLLAAGAVLLAAFVGIERMVRDPLFQLSLFRIRAFTAGNVAGLAVSIARGGLQFMLIIWLQGIWLPLSCLAFARNTTAAVRPIPR